MVKNLAAFVAFATVAMVRASPQVETSNAPSVSPSTTVSQSMPPAATQGFDIANVTTNTLFNWCLAQVNSCPQVCGGAASVNTCDSSDLQYTCICPNGTVPDCTAYINTVPYYVCQVTFAQCINNNANDVEGQAQCSTNEQCGMRNATAELLAAREPSPAQPSSSSYSSSSVLSTTSSTSSSKEVATSATPTSSVAAPSTTLASDVTKPYSPTGAIAGGVVGGLLLVALGLFLFWFIRRKRIARQNSIHKSTVNNNSGNGGVGTTIDRNATTKSYNKPELEATTRTFQKPELEASTVPTIESGPKPIATSAVAEIDAPLSVSRSRAELSGGTAAQGTNGQPTSPTTMRREMSIQEEQRQLLKEQEEEARLAELAHQRRQAELDYEYQKRIAALEHEQRMAELNVTAARLRGRDRTLSELEARTNPGPGSGD